ncbi:MAG: hypothetical protein UU96_C0029G0004 [Parcubacteria group bacterium GW2011_GWC2_42_13]|nr:MAG: hypothetical protein UU96_C0029G0004 [Parcubacteria group bacterium GW2011_GWC2_42_13]
MSVFELNIDSHARWRGAQVFLNSCLIKKNYVCPLFENARTYFERKG